MTWTRLFLGIEGLVFAAIGAWTLLAPNAVAKVIEIMLPTPSATAGARVLGMATQGHIQPGFHQFLASEVGTVVLAILFQRYVLNQVRIG